MLIAVKTKRQSITMWALLVWAYRRHMVRYEVDRAGSAPGVAGGLLAEFMRQRAGYAAERGCINGAGTSAHDDAHVVHRHVLGLRPAERELVMATGEAGKPPEWDPAIPPLRIVPKRKAGTGAIQRIWSPSGNPIGCLIEYVGVPDDVAALIREKARDQYAMWWHALRRLRSAMWVEEGLTLWKVSRTGVDAEPWNTAY